TLGFDRGRKGAYYAEAGIAEYWIVNIPERQVEVYRNPHADPAAEWGFVYDAPVIARIGDTVSPLATQQVTAPNATIAVADLLPAAD
ncbi:MAG: Uma2 family endonuclease, partial [Armatimonadetes bacterium]|nr:Uma2 family endonuclease [Armatimonadota bacterium]